MNRRHLLKSAAAGTITLNAFPHHLFASEAKKYATDRVKLGPRQVEVSHFVHGAGTGGVGGSSNQTRKLGMRGLADLFIAGYGSGLMLWDSADQYSTHPYIRKALKVPREKVVILMKTQASADKEMRADLEVVRTHGTSCHTLGALKPGRKPALGGNRSRALQRVSSSDGLDSERSLWGAWANERPDKGVIGMKILGAGKLRDKPLAHNHIDCFTIGAESIAGMEDLVKKIPAASVRG